LILKFDYSFSFANLANPNMKKVLVYKEIKSAIQIT